MVDLSELATGFGLNTKIACRAHISIACILDRSNIMPEHLIKKQRISMLERHASVHVLYSKW